MITKRGAIFLLFLSSFAICNDSWNEGMSIGGQLLSTFKGNMDSRINKPLTSKTKLHTIDNSKSDYVNISCNEETPFVKVSYSGYGDIDISVYQDLNFDGNYEKTTYISGVSGICSNGFIKCSPNTWNNCKYYQYTYSNGLSYTKTSLQNLGGCYCINSSCGNLASTEKKQILNDIAGSISYVFKESRNYIISKVVTGNFQSLIYGKSINCDNQKIPTHINENNIDSLASQKTSDETYALIADSGDNVNKNYKKDTQFQSTLQNRSTTAINTAKYNKNSNTYSYVEGLNNQKVDGTIQLGDIERSKFCEVEWVEKDTTVYADNKTKNEATNDPSTKKREIRECKQNGNSWICPVNPSKGETIKHDCGAINDFAEVTSALSAVNEASKDMVCSTK